MKKRKLKTQKAPQFMEKVYKEYKPRLFNFLIYKVNGNKHIAEEILSDTIYSALLSTPNVKNKDRKLTEIKHNLGRISLKNLFIMFDENCPV